MSDLGFVEHKDGSWRIAKKKKDPHAWVKYDGMYNKQYYDIKLKNGDVIKHCWPNAGTFHTPVGNVYPGAGLYIRVSKKQF